MCRSRSLLVGLAALVACAAPNTTTPPLAVAEPAPLAGVEPVPGDLLASPLPGDPLQVTVHALSNGMRVYISPDHTKPVFDARIVVKAGSRHEPADATGLAHYLEHMLFKGTDRLGTRNFEAERPHLERIAALYDELKDAKDEQTRTQILEEIDAHTVELAEHVAPNEVSWVLATIGASGVNASTARDTTRYKVDNVPTNHLETWARLEAERFRNPQFRLFHPELEAVYEEKNRAMDNARRNFFMGAMTLSFGEHPYARPNIGWPEHLRTPAYSAMVEFYERWYVPENMAVVLVGDIDTQKALEVLERTIGRLPAREAPAQPHSAVTPSQESKIVVKGDDAAVSLSWPTVPQAHPDSAPLRVMSQIFSDGDAGLVQRELVRKREVTGESAANVQYREAGFWLAQASVRPDQTHADVAAALLRVVDMLKAGEFDDAMVAAVKLQFELGDAWSLESRPSRARKIVDSLDAGTSWKEYVALQTAMRAVTADDVVEVANRYLAVAPGIVELQRGEPEIPKLDPPKITPLKIESTRRSEFAKGLVGRKVEPLAPAFATAGEDFHRGELPAGPYVAVANELSEMVFVIYDFEYGMRDDPLICESLEAMESGGTGSRDANALQAELSRLGTQPWTWCGADGMRIGFVTLDRNLEASAALFHEWLRELSLSDDVVSAVTHSTIEERKDDYGDARVLASALSAYALQGKQSRYLIQASNAELSKLDAAGVTRRITELVKRPHRTYYYGPRDAELAADAIALPEPELPARPAPAQRYIVRSKPTVLLVDKKLAKSDVRVNHVLHSDWDSRDPVPYVLESYYDGGMSSLLFQEVREARALAYSVWGGVESPDRPGDDVAADMGVQTAADKTLDATAALLEIASRPIDATRLDQVVNAEIQAMRRWRWEPRWLAGRVESWERLGLDADPRRARWDALQTTSVEDVEAFRTRIDAEPPVITIVGDRKAMDTAKLEALGKLEVIDPKDLFSY